MGVVSRRVVPACGNLCFLCPSMRARSRQPVKRYKKLISQIFPDNPQRISKLCDYASKNPLRIPKITQLLELRCFKDLRNHNFPSVAIVFSIYAKLLSLCPNQMPLFGASLLGLIRAVLDQSPPQQQMRLVACQTLVKFIAAQKDTSFIFNFDSLIPKLCHLAHPLVHPLLRSAALQSLASMLSFMAHHSHLSIDFDTIISVMLENFPDKVESETTPDWQDHRDTQNPSLSLPDLDFTTDKEKSPCYWARVCLSNMANLAKEATTVRRVLEPLFHAFDTENHWSPDKGLAFPVLLHLQSLLEESGQNSHILLSILVKHLDHKSVSKHPVLQINILNVATQLAKSAKQRASVAIIGALTDLVKYLRKILQNQAEELSQKGTNTCNSDLLMALEKCIWQLAEKVGDIGPVLDLMAVMLENIPSSTIAVRTTILAIYRASNIISSVPNLYNEKKAFPDGLFHQLLLAMTHPDHETRVGAHRIFSMVLMPSVHSHRLDENMKHLGVSGFSDTCESGTIDKKLREESNNLSDACISFKGALAGEKAVYLPFPNCQDLTALRLSSHQVSLLLSSIWVQAISAENTPANFEAMAHSYTIALMFTRSKVSSYAALVRCFQLALSLRTLSLDSEGALQPSRRRSMFTLASFMLLSSANVGNFPDLISIVKASFTDKMVDPHLQLVDDVRLQAVLVDTHKGVLYGVDEDEVVASNSLSIIELDDHQLKETLISNFVSRYANMSEDEVSSLKKEILQRFSPDDAYPSGASLFMETPRPGSPIDHEEFLDEDETLTLAEEDAYPEASGSQSDRKTSISGNSVDVLSVNQLIESVVETARQVGSLQGVSATPVAYEQMKEQCEALVTGKHHKMSVVLHSCKHFQENNYPSFVPALDYKEWDQSKEAIGVKEHKSFRLPPSSPYDKFLKAAAC